MAKTPTGLFSFAQKCDSFILRLESSLQKRGGKIVLCLARYRDSGRFKSKQFPAKMLRQAFDYAQQRANELGQDVRIVVEAELKDEHGGDAGLYGIATIKPSSLETQTLSRLPILPCSECSNPATHQFVARYTDEVSVIEHGCNEHIEGILSYWA